MPNHSSIFSFSRENPLAGFVICALLVLAIESALAFRAQNTLITSLTTSRIPDKSPDLQIMGDSLAHFGIRAERLAEKLPDTTVLNKSIPGTGPAFSYFMLKRQLAAGVAPKAILCGSSSHGFGATHTALLVSTYATWPEIAESAASGKEPFEIIYGIICRASYTLRHREQLGEMLKGRRNQAEAETEIIAKNQSAPMPGANPYPLSGVYPMYRKPFKEAPFAMHFFHRFLETARENKIPVHWVSMPALAVTNEARAPYRYQEDYAKFLARHRDQFGLHLLIAENPVLPPENFRDYAHLNPTGAALFTDTLAGALLKARQTPTP